MKYDKSEIITVETATSEACAQVNMAYYQLGEFYDKYFMQADSKGTLIFDLENRHESVEYLMMGILESIRRAKIELDVFCNPTSYTLSCFMHNVKEKQDVIEEIIGQAKQVKAV